MSLKTGIATRTNGAPPPEVPLSDIHLESLDFWGLDDDFRDGAFATLRREAPISFWPAIEMEGFVAGDGYWALTRHDDVHFASRHPEIFSSTPNITVNDNAPEIAEYFGSMIVLDDPRHQRLRSIVSRAFTPKVVARIEASVRERARRLVASLIANHPNGEADLVTELAGPLPLQIICDMMGIPEEDHQRIFHWTNVILGFGDPDLTTDFDDFLKISMDIGAYASALAEDRRVNHHDDLTTSLVEAEVDGERLSSAEIASFFILLVVAGNETTRNAISHGVLALSRYPDERDKWWSNFDRSGTHGGRGDRAMGLAGGLHAADPDPRLQAQRHQAGGRRQGRAVVQLGQPRRVKVRQPLAFRRGAHPQPPFRVRRRRGAFLPGRQPRSPRDPGRFRRVAPRDTRHRRDRRTRAAAVAIHPRHQGPAGRLDPAALISREQGAPPRLRADTKSHCSA